MGAMEKSMKSVETLGGMKSVEIGGNQWKICARIVRSQSFRSSAQGRLRHFRRFAIENPHRIRAVRHFRGFQ